MLLACFVDASLADSLTDSKSTTGTLFAIVGPNTFVPLHWICKKQGAVSHSSTEAEIISMETALRTEGLSFATLFDLIHTVFQADEGEIEGPGGEDSKVNHVATRDEAEIHELSQSLAEIQFSKLSLQPGLWSEENESEDETTQSACSAIETEEN